MKKLNLSPQLKEMEKKGEIVFENQTEPNIPRLWQLGNDVTELESLLIEILEAEDLSQEEKDERASVALQDWIAAGESFDEKALRVAEYIKHQEALAEARKAEYRRIRALAEQAQSSANSLRRYLSNEMIRTNHTKIEGVKAKLSVRRNMPKVLLNCEPEDLPPECVKVTYEPRLTEIRKALKENPDIEWAFFSNTVEYGLTIR
jgi:hypothetical protein